MSVLMGNGDGTFQKQQTYATGDGPLSVAVADLDGDRAPDLAVANRLGTVSVLLGNGDGTFQAEQTFAAGVQPVAAAAGDFNNDNKPDLAVADYHTGTVDVLLGNGDGTFGAAQTFAAGSTPHAVAVADFNRDGKADLVVANQGSNTVSVLLGSGGGAFGPPQAFGAGPVPWAVAVADLNNDKVPDLAVANEGDGTVSVLLGKGDGTFGGQRALAAGGGPEGVAVADVNGDGQADLVVAGPGSTPLSVLLGNGDGTFQEPRAVPTTLPLAGPVAVGDFNGDGKPDLAVTSGDNQHTVGVLLGNGDGTFRKPVPFGVGSFPTALAVADFDGDKKADLAVTYSGDNAVRLFPGNGDGTFQAGQTFATGVSPLALAVADFNEDNKPDLATVNGEGRSVGVLLNQSAAAPPLAATTTVLVSQTNPTTVGQPATFTATVTGANGAPIAAGTVTFLDGARLLATVPLSNGTASLTTAALSAGTHLITVAYGGDGSDFPSSGVVAQQVSRVASSTALTQSGAPAKLGQPVTLTATVRGAGPAPTGTVTFRDRGAVLAADVPLDGSGVATLTTTALAGGTASLTAAYSGDGTYAGSTSDAVTAPISPISPTTAVTVSGSPVVVGATVTFTATVGGDGPTPTGTVTFRDGAAVLAADVDMDGGGVATFSTAALAAGPHAITAAYSGDNNYTAGTSPPVTVQVVVPPAIQSVTISSSGPGGAVTPGSVLTAHVTASAPDGEPVTFAYQWSRNGVALAGATGPALDLGQPGHGSPGDTLTVTVTPSDPSATGAAVSASVTVVAPPVPPPGPVGIVLGLRRVGGKKVLAAVVSFTSGAPRVLVSPFQKPPYRSIAAALVDLNGDGTADAVAFTAQLGRRKVRRVVPL